jgi:2'-5' RNA ligase
LRLFLAIDIPSEIREGLTKIQNHFKSLDLDASWVRPGNIHLTLKFLGSTEPEKISQIVDIMNTCVKSTAPISLSLNEVGGFPNLKQPRVLWVGLADAQGSLVSAQKNMDRNLAKLGFEADKKIFFPHLTLARIKSPKGRQAIKHKVASLQMGEKKTFSVTSIKLYKSELTPRGAIYTSLHEFNIKPSGATL